MPNTLAHIGIQGPISKLGMPAAPLQWIILGSLIPDIPWIMQRFFKLIPAIDLISLRLYSVTQASLIFSLILALTLALFTSKPRFIFLILSINSLLHLLLDACQTKWGNGVNFEVPFSWHITNFGLFWPEDSISYLLTAAGVIVLLLCYPKAVKSDLFLQKPTGAKTIILFLSILIYIAGPFLFIQAAYNADVHFSKTTHTMRERTGKIIEIDRGTYEPVTKTIATYADNALSVTNPPAILKAGKISIRGVFDKTGSVTITEYHEHNRHRDYASYIGLLFILLLWLPSITGKVSKQNTDAQKT